MINLSVCDLRIACLYREYMWFGIENIRVRPLSRHDNDETPRTRQVFAPRAIGVRIRATVISQPYLLYTRSGLHSDICRAWIRLIVVACAAQLKLWINSFARRTKPHHLAGSENRLRATLSAVHTQRFVIRSRNHCYDGKHVWLDRSLTDRPNARNMLL
jgi:hypothetical protein